MKLSLVALMSYVLGSGGFDGRAYRYGGCAKRTSTKSASERMKRRDKNHARKNSKRKNRKRK